MKLALPTKRRTPVCFDVGAAGVRAVQLVRRRGFWRATDSLAVDLLRGAFDENYDEAKPALGRVARLVGQGAFDGREVGLILSPPEVAFHPLKLPNRALAQSPEHVQSALAWEVSRETRTEPGQLEVRYWQLPAGHRQGLNVMAAAVPTETARGWFTTLHRESLLLRRIDVAPCVLTRLVSQLQPPDASDLWGVLDLGHRHTTLTIAIGDTPIYVRSLSHGSARWTRRLADAFEVPLHEAERVKRERGIRPDPGNASASFQIGGDVPGVVFGVLRDSLDELARAITLCFTYALQNYNDLRPQRLWLAGTGSLLPGLDEYLAEILEMDVRTLRNETAGTLPCFDPATAVAVGGALQATGAR